MRQAIAMVVILIGWAGSARADVRPELRTEYGDETKRLRQHFDEVVGEMMRRDISDLTPSQRAARMTAIERLLRYRADGVFPKNRHFATFTPYFIDDSGTRCAMASLIEQSGERELVARVARTANNAYIAELARDPALRPALIDWLEANGITLAEAAQIQPTYEPPECDTPCRDDELCVYTEDGTACSRICDPEGSDTCGSESQCVEMFGGPACSPPVMGDGEFPEPEGGYCSAAGSATGPELLLLVAVILLFGRRRRSAPPAQ